MIKSWLTAARLRTLPLALSCTFMGSAVALEFGAFDALIFTFAILTTTALQILSNFANDYGDYKNGADTLANRQDRMLTSGAITEKQMKTGLILTSVASFVLGLGLLLVSFSLSELVELAVLLGIGLGAIWAALKYTAGDNPYGYRGLGDLFVFLFFGLVGVVGTVYLYVHQVKMLYFVYAVVIGCFSVAVLNLNNMRDIHSDAKAGKVTIPVRLGFIQAKVYHYLLIGTGWIGVLRVALEQSSSWYFMLLLPLGIQLKHLAKVKKCTDPKELDGELKKIALTTFLISLIFFGISILS